MPQNVSQTEIKVQKLAKRRALSIGRAQKMHEARTNRQTELIAPVSKPLPAIMIGCSGWFYWDWKGQFYPEDMPTSKWFEYYAGHFKTVELNAPFYNWPTVNTVKTWLKQANDEHFIYTVKVNELITHVKRFKGTKTLVKDFCHIADMLGPQMGCFLFQLPPSYHYTFSRLRHIISQLDHSRRNVVEFRHKSWWNNRVYEAFRKKGIIFCSCSAPDLPDELIKTSDEIYIRFHGTKKWYRHNYSREELEEWSSKIKEANPKRIWAYFNNDYDTYAIQNAQVLIKELNL